MTDWPEVYRKAVADLSDDPDDEFGLSYASCVRDDVMKAGMDDAEVIREADLGLVKAARRAVGDPLMPDNSEKWWDNLEAISKGEFPLEKLPEHIRQSVRELYYRLQRQRRRGENTSMSDTQAYGGDGPARV